MSGDTIPVGLGELRVSSQRGQILACYGLGSCIGLALYDRIAHTGALVHIVLPDSQLNRGQGFMPGKFANTAVPAAVHALARQGVLRSRLLARMVGGARMLAVAGVTKLDIGARNAEAVRAALQAEEIPLAAQDTGGTYGRTLQLFIDTGRLLVSTVGRGEREI